MEEKFNINEKLFYYLVRHCRVFFPPNNVFNTSLPHLMVDDKFYQIEGNKKYLKQRIYNLIEEDKPELFESKELIGSINKTIKEFIKSANKISK